MTPPNTPRKDEVREIAEALSDAQRAALTKAEVDGNLGRYFSRFISIPAGRGLVKAGLATAVWSGVMLSRLGEQVRAYLKESGDADQA